MRVFASLSSLLTLALSLSSSLCAVSASHEPVKRADHHRRSASLAVRDPGHLSKRFANARFSYYADGVGACGKTNSPGDFIVALNSAQYGGGQYCFETITISYQGKSTQATIVDECPGCPFAGLDMSEGLFNFFAPESEGIIYGEWDFGGSAEPATTSSPKPTPKPTTSSTPPPPPATSTSKHTTSAAPTTSSAPTSSSTPTSTKPSTTSTTPTSTQPTVTDASVATAGAVQDSGDSGLYTLNLALVSMGMLLDQASQAQ